MFGLDFADLWHISKVGYSAILPQRLGQIKLSCAERKVVFQDNLVLVLDNRTILFWEIINCLSYQTIKEHFGGL